MRKNSPSLAIEGMEINRDLNRREIVMVAERNTQDVTLRNPMQSLVADCERVDV